MPAPPPPQRLMLLLLLLLLIQLVSGSPVPEDPQFSTAVNTVKSYCTETECYSFDAIASSWQFTASCYYPPYKPGGSGVQPLYYGGQAVHQYCTPANCYEYTGTGYIIIPGGGSGNGVSTVLTTVTTSGTTTSTSTSTTVTTTTLTGTTTATSTQVLTSTTSSTTTTTPQVTSTFTSYVTTTTSTIFDTNTIYSSLTTATQADFTEVVVLFGTLEIPVTEAGAEATTTLATGTTTITVGSTTTTGTTTIVLSQVQATTTTAVVTVPASATTTVTTTTTTASATQTVGTLTTVLSTITNTDYTLTFVTAQGLGLAAAATDVPTLDSALVFSTSSETAEDEVKVSVQGVSSHKQPEGDWWAVYHLMSQNEALPQHVYTPQDFDASSNAYYTNDDDGDDDREEGEVDQVASAQRVKQPPNEAIDWAKYLNVAVVPVDQ